MLIAERREHHDELRPVTCAADASAKCFSAARPISITTEQQEDEDAGGGQRLELAMAVRVVLVGRLARGAQPDQADDVGRRSVSEWKPSEMMLTAPVA